MSSVTIPLRLAKNLRRSIRQSIQQTGTASPDKGASGVNNRQANQANRVSGEIRQNTNNMKSAQQDLRNALMDKNQAMLMHQAKMNNIQEFVSMVSNTLQKMNQTAMSVINNMR